MPHNEILLISLLAVKLAFHFWGDILKEDLYPAQFL